MSKLLPEQEQRFQTLFLKVLLIRGSKSGQNQKHWETPKGILSDPFVGIWYGGEIDIVATSRTPTANGLFIKKCSRERWNKITEHPDMITKREETRRYRQMFNRTKEKYKEIFQRWCANHDVKIENYPTHIQNWLQS